VYVWLDVHLALLAAVRTDDAEFIHAHQRSASMKESAQNVGSALRDSCPHYRPERAGDCGGAARAY
jgi:hypothetical protein